MWFEVRWLIGPLCNVEEEADSATFVEMMEGQPVYGRISVDVDTELFRHFSAQCINSVFTVLHMTGRQVHHAVSKAGVLALLHQNSRPAA